MFRLLYFCKNSDGCSGRLLGQPQSRSGLDIAAKSKICQLYKQRLVKKANLAHKFIPSITLIAVLQIGRSLVRSQLGISGFFIDINPSDRTMPLGSTQPLIEMSTRSISWG